MKDPRSIEKVIVKIGNQEFDQTHTPAERVLAAVEMWNDFMINKSTKAGGLKSTEKEITEFTVDVAIFLLKRRISVDFGRWFKGLFLTRKKVLRSMNMTQLNEFIDKSLTPILGSKKKGMIAQKKLHDATAEMLDKMKVEDLTKLLESLASLQDGVGEKFTA